MSDSSKIIIAELVGKERTIELTGTGQPHRGAVNWGSDLHLVTEWYQGNPEATQHVIGPRDPPSHWEGTWRRTQLSRNPAIVTFSGSIFRVVNPHELCTAFETIQRAGARLRVTWQDVTPAGFTIFTVREGRMSSFNAKPDRITDIPWTADFVWVGRGAGPQRVASTRDGGAADAKDALESQLTDFGDSLAATTVATILPGRFPKVPSSLTLGQLEALANGPLALVQSVTRSIQSKISDLQRLGQIAATLKDEPFAIAEAVSDAAQNTVSIAKNFYNTMSGQPAEVQSRKTDAASVIRASSTFGATIDSQRRLARAAQAIADQNRAIVTRNPGGPGASARRTSAMSAAKLLAVHVCRRGDTPQRLSTHYYRTPDLAVEILQANELPWNTVTFDVGKTLIIPLMPSKKRS